MIKGLNFMRSTFKSQVLSIWVRALHMTIHFQSVLQTKSFTSRNHREQKRFVCVYIIIYLLSSLILYGVKTNPCITIQLQFQWQLFPTFKKSNYLGSHLLQLCRAKNVSCYMLSILHEIAYYTIQIIVWTSRG